jgi:hypothetical protein
MSTKTKKTKRAEPKKVIKKTAEIKKKKTSEKERAVKKTKRAETKERKPSIKEEDLSETVLKTKTVSELKSIIRKLKKVMPVEGSGVDGKILKKDLINVIMRGGTRVKYVKVKTPKKEISFIEMDVLAESRTPLRLKMSSPKKSPLRATPLGLKMSSPSKQIALLGKTPLTTKISSPVKPRSPSQNVSRIFYPIQYKKIRADIEKTKKASPVKSKTPLKMGRPKSPSPIKYEIYAKKEATTGFTRKSPSPKKSLVIETRSYTSPVITRSYTPIKTENPLFVERKTPKKTSTPKKSTGWWGWLGYK